MQFKQMLRSLKNSGFQDFLQLLKLKNTTVRIISSLIQYPQFIYDSFHIGTSFVKLILLEMTALDQKNVCFSFATFQVMGMH